MATVEDEQRLVDGDAAPATSSSDETSSTESSSPSRRRLFECRNVFSILTVEPIILLVTFSFGIQSIIGQDLLIFKCCHVNLGYAVDVCANLSANPAQQVEVQKLAATVSMYQNILTALPSIVVSLFFGPWSDKHGRKPLLIAPIIGFCFAQAVYIGCNFFASLKAEFLLLSAFSNVFGGFTCLLIGVYGYIADVSRLRSRTSRVAFVDLFLFVSYPAGVFASDFIYKLGGFYLNFGLGFGLNVAALLFTVFALKESQENRDVSADADLKLFDVKNVFSVFRAVFKRREGGLRSALLLLLLAMMLNIAGNYDSGTTYLFTRLTFSWTEKEYTLWSSSTSVARALVTFSCMPILSLKLQIHDALIGLLGSTIAIAAYLVYAFSYAPWMFYLAGAISIVCSTPSIVIRSLISKIVPKTELGKVFSLLSSLESAVPLIISPIVVSIYKATIDHFAGTIFLVFSGLAVFISLALLGVYVIMKRSNIVCYERLHNGDSSIANSSTSAEPSQNDSTLSSSDPDV